MSNQFSEEHVFGDDLNEEEMKAYYKELQKSGEQLYFNGINGATGEYDVPPMTGEALASIITGGSPPENLDELGLKQAAPYPIKPPNDPTRLDQAGWAVIFPAKTDPAIKKALGELLELREEQAGDRFKIYEGSKGYRPGEKKTDFFKRHKIGGGPADPEQMPYYVLIVASPAEIPYEFQYQLDVMRGVGRIHFDTPQDYANYAHNVTQAETGQVKLSRQASFFGVANPDDQATQLSSKYLVRPLYQKLQAQQPFTRWVEEGDVRRKQQLDWQFETLLAEQATKAQLGRLLGGDQTPALLFTASHGMGFPLNDSRQLPHQGALLCQDWPGPNQWRGSIEQDFYFAGDDLTSDANLLGLITLHFACFSAGTSRVDQFAKQAFKDERAVIAPHNFIGALPKSLLSHGALAVIGHVERAWGYSFLSPGAGAQTGVFEGALHQLLSGDPVGWITENMNMRYADLATNLSAVLEELDYDPNYINPYDLAQMWTANNDARSYVVIGDPAARIPFALPDESPVERPPIEIVTFRPPDTTTTLEPAPFPAAEGVDVTTVEYGLFDSSALKETKERLSNSIREFAQKLGRVLEKAVDDATSLEVCTYVSDDMTQVTRDFTKTADLRAFTCIKIDGDTMVCVPKRKGEIDESLWAIHVDMVQQAQANRTEMIKTAVSAATGLLDALKVL